ncbi:hypothetical protein Efla_007147 [Eimeria flavescens]
MVSSIELLKLAYEGALTLKRSLGSLLLQDCCADNLAVDGVSLVLTTKSTVSLNVCTAVSMWRSRVLEQGRLQTEHFAGAAKEKATHRKRRRRIEREGDEQNGLSQRWAGAALPISRFALSDIIGDACCLAHMLQHTQQLVL